MNLYQRENISDQPLKLTIKVIQIINMILYFIFKKMIFRLIYYSDNPLAFIHCFIYCLWGEKSLSLDREKYLHRFTFYSISREIFVLVSGVWRTSS